MMQDKESVTIVSVTHNNVGTIRRSLDSVTKGVRPANQVIVGDNDSTDGTYDLMCKILGAKQITLDGKKGLPPEFEGTLNGVPVRIFRKRISSAGHTLNIAMQSKWQGVTIFGFMDPVSWYSPDKIAQSIRAFQSNPSIACVVSDCDNYHSDGRVERVFRNSFDMQRLLAGYPYDGNFLVRSQVFISLKSGFNEQMAAREEYDLMLRISEIGLIYHIPAPLHNNTITPVDDAARQRILQSEKLAQQMVVRRRGQPGD
jgi:GT2 family glycosyltransferase